MEVDGVDKADYWKVVDQCYLCDLCYLTKCPYVPPHEWNVDFPHLMLRAKAIGFKKGRASCATRCSPVPTRSPSAGQHPLIDVNVVNALNRNEHTRAAAGIRRSDIHPEARLPEYHSNRLRKRTPQPPAGRQIEHAGRTIPPARSRSSPPVTATTTRRRSARTCSRCSSTTAFHIGGARNSLLRHAQAGTGRPGHREKLKNQANIPVLAKLVDEGWDIDRPDTFLRADVQAGTAADVPGGRRGNQKVQQARFSIPSSTCGCATRRGPAEDRLPRTPLGNIAYQVACHQRVQNIGLKTRDVLNLVPDTEVDAHRALLRPRRHLCVKQEFRDKSMKIARPVVRKVDQKEPDAFASDCPMAAPISPTCPRKLDGRSTP